MKTSLWGGVVLLAAAIRSGAGVDVSVGVDIHAPADFYSPLAGTGAWVDVGHFGRCWHPNGVAAEWRPYCNGEWVWTDSGWYWSSDEPWAWACYHYGSWDLDPQIGWFWVPGIEWSPAWVTWRSGGGYIGWAPVGPGGVAPGANLFAFVEIGHFGGPIRPTTVVVNNATIISKTTVMHNVRHDSRDLGNGSTRRITINDGPSAAEVEKATGKRFTPAPLAEAVRRTPAPRAVEKPALPAQPAPLVHPESPGNTQPPTRPELPERPENPGRSEKPVPPRTQERPIVPERPNVPEKPATPEKPEPPRKPEDAPHALRAPGGRNGFESAHRGPQPA